MTAKALLVEKRIVQSVSNVKIVRVVYPGRTAQKKARKG
jgi:hypothetical protein